MPPMISDEESNSSDGIDEIPARAAPTKDEIPDEDDNEDGSDDGDDGDEYKVEKILKHDFSEEGAVIYQIKWLGYNKKSDLTWEPVENLANAPEILEAYHETIGGPPENTKPKSVAKKGPGRKKRTAADAFEDSPAPTTGSKRKSNGAAEKATPLKRDLPKGSWEANVLRVSSILEDAELEAKGKNRLVGLLEWNDGGSKTQHPMQVLRLKCPQKLLDYYEQHLVFKDDTGPEPPTPMDD